MSDARYDFVIVGGGSAGCVLANRVSADPACKVLVLEAGRPDAWWDVLVHMPAALALPLGSRFYDWRYRSEPEPHMAGRQIYHARGKVLGGVRDAGLLDRGAVSPSARGKAPGRSSTGAGGSRGCPS